jgi:hypothetical protein
MNDALPMWTIYDHPSDYPAGYVARQWLIQGGTVVSTDVLLYSSEVEPIRRQLSAVGLVRVPRSDGDDPVILETWF